MPRGLTVATTAGFAAARNSSISGGTGTSGIARAYALPLLGPAREAAVRLPERHRLRERVGVLARVGQLRERVLDELFLRRAAFDRLRPVEQAQLKLFEVPLDVVGDAEVDEREALWLAARDLVERRLPRRDIDVRRRRRRHDRAAGQNAHAARVAGVERPVGVEVADVVRRVARRWGRTRGRATAPSSGWTFSAGTGASSPQSESNVSPYSRRALFSSRSGSTRCGAPTGETCTCSAGFLRTSTPAAPAWSRWMCVSRRWRMSVSVKPRAARPASSASMHVVGPQSRSAGPSVVSRR